MKPQSDRDNKGKPRMSILPTIALEAMLDLEGVDRYDDRADYEREIHAFLLSFFNRGNFDNLLSAAKMALDWTEMACTGALPFRSDPHLGIQKLIQVGEAGAVKYDAHNWRKGNKASQFFDCALRHHEKCFVMGDDIDPEDGCYHAAKITWNCLVAHELNRQGRLIMDLAGSHYEDRDYKHYVEDQKAKDIEEDRAARLKAGPHYERDRIEAERDDYADRTYQMIKSFRDSKSADRERWASQKKDDWKVGDKFVAQWSGGCVDNMREFIGKTLVVEKVNEVNVEAGGWFWEKEYNAKIEEEPLMERIRKNRDESLEGWSSQREPRLEKDFREQATEEGSINA